jgi:hypothetical protein
MNRRKEDIYKHPRAAYPRPPPAQNRKHKHTITRQPRAVPHPYYPKKFQKGNMNISKPMSSRAAPPPFPKETPQLKKET